MDEALLYDRLQFALTITFHYLFPQLTMGLAMLIVYLKTRGLWTGNEHYNDAARFRLVRDWRMPPRMYSQRCDRLHNGLRHLERLRRERGCGAVFLSPAHQSFQCAPARSRLVVLDQ